jgi:hypothetical protein
LSDFEPNWTDGQDGEASPAAAWGAGQAARRHGGLQQKLEEGDCMSRKICAALVAALAAAGVTGCSAGLSGYSVRDQGAAQSDVIGDVVHVAATFCLDNETVAAGTPAAASKAPAFSMPPVGDGACGGTDGDQAGFFKQLTRDSGIQFFAAFLVPDGASAPATATAQLPSGFDTATATLTRKPSLDETLEHTRPAPAGRRWVGYISPVVGAAQDMANPQELAAHLRIASEADVPAPVDPTQGDWSAEADFRPARGEGGLPAPATFGHAVMGGVRMAYPEEIYDGADTDNVDPLSPAYFGLQLLDSRPVDCQELRGFPFLTLFGQELASLPADARGLPLLTTTLCGHSSADSSLALKDLRGSGNEVTVAPGASVRVPFTLRYAGEAGPTFELSATTAVPGATATPDPAALTPSAAGFQDAGVTIAVPAGTAPGAYAVTLTAKVGGQARSAQGVVNVSAPAAVVTAASGEAAGTGTPTVAGAGTVVAGRGRFLEFRGFDRSGLGPDGRSINLGDALCHKLTGSCGFVTVQLAVRWEQLHAGAERATAAKRQRVRMVTVGTAHLSVPAQARRRVRVAVAPSIRRMIQSGDILHAVVSVRPAHNRVPIVHRIALRRG